MTRENPGADARRPERSGSTEVGLGGTDGGPDTGAAPGSDDHLRDDHLHGDHLRDGTGAGVGGDTGAAARGSGAPGREVIDRGVLIGSGMRWLSDWALRLAIVLVAGWLLYQVGGTLWSGVLPVLLALIVATVLWPPVRWLTDHGMPAALAAVFAVVAGLTLVFGTLAAVAPSAIEQATALGNSTTQGIWQIQDWLQGPPLNIQDEQLNGVVDKVTGTLQNRTDAIANGVFSGVTAIGSAVVTLVMVLVLTFFFLKDGRGFLPWVRSIVGHRAGLHLTEVLTRSWNTLGGYIRAQAIVSAVDAVLIGLGLVVLGVPLAWALAILTFFGGFIPIVGAFAAGAIAVLVALVAKGFTTALIVLVIIVVVQQLEGNVLSPMLQSRAMELHPGIVILVVAAGGTLYGIVGAFLAVPVAAVTAVVLRYIGEQIDLRTGEKSAADIRTATDEGRITARAGELHRIRFVPEKLRRAGASPDADPHTGDDEAAGSSGARGSSDRLSRLVGSASALWARRRGRRGDQGGRDRGRAD